MIMIILLYTCVYAVKHENKNQELYMGELFELGPFHRLLFTIVFLAFATAINIKFWQNHGINYIHLMQIEYKDRLNGYQLWKVASILLFFFLFLVYESIQEMETIYHDFAKPEIVDVGED